jgi:hypothetical protein
MKVGGNHLASPIETSQKNKRTRTDKRQKEKELSGQKRFFFDSSVESKSSQNV